MLSRKDVLIAKRDTLHNYTAVFKVFADAFGDLVMIEDSIQYICHSSLNEGGRRYAKTDKYNTSNNTSEADIYRVVSYDITCTKPEIDSFVEHGKDVSDFLIGVYEAKTVRYYGESPF